MALSKEDLAAISGLLEPLSEKITALQNHVENETDRNIEILNGKLTALQDHVENETDRKLLALSQHIENETDRNLLALSQHIENETDRKLLALSLHIENETDKRVQAVAENHSALSNKLDQILIDRKKDIFFDVEISSLKSRVSRLEERVKGITA